MTTEHQATPEEKAYERLLDEAWETLTWPAQAIFNWAEQLAYYEGIDRDYDTAIEFCDLTMDKIRFVTEGLTDRDKELLTQIVRAARTAADSLDPEDHETIAGFRVHPAELHHWNEMTADHIEGILRKVNERRRKMEDPSYIPF